MSRTSRIVALCALVSIVGVACSDDDTADTASIDAGTTTTTAPEPEVLRILVTNDDGVGADGIDAVVEALRALDAVEVTVVGPAENQSGTSDNTTAGTVPVSETTTVSGYPAIAVDGFPADSVTYALDEVLDETPHLVVSGSNEGQNIGPLVDVSGTVGAARTAARRGIPALAVSQGLGEPPQFSVSAELVVSWVEEHRAELLDHDAAAGPTTVANLNVPSCPTPEVRGVVEVPVASEFGANDPFTVDCASTLEDPVDDVTAFVNGYAALSELDAA
ncbi:MAG TPA: 5'/3'-nucleotidase SurE [Acidimicrobiia bacterium]|nr:5'/3'-nucleotidase SurE [Acidimicrobiia bacterium]